jgi:hypothetical protein
MHQNYSTGKGSTHQKTLVWQEEQTPMEQAVATREVLEWRNLHRKCSVIGTGEASEKGLQWSSDQMASFQCLVHVVGLRKTQVAPPIYLVDT